MYLFILVYLLTYLSLFICSYLTNLYRRFSQHVNVKRFDWLLVKKRCIKKRNYYYYHHNLILECGCADRGILRQRLHSTLLQCLHVSLCQLVSPMAATGIRFGVVLNACFRLDCCRSCEISNRQLVVTVTFLDVTEAFDGASANQRVAVFLNATFSVMASH